MYSMISKLIVEEIILYTLNSSLVVFKKANLVKCWILWREKKQNFVIRFFLIWLKLIYLRIDKGKIKVK